MVSAKLRKKKDSSDDSLTKMTTKSYDTHDNGSRKFHVEVTSRKTSPKTRVTPISRVEVRRIVSRKTRPMFSFSSPQVFIGKSSLNPMTEYSGGHGPMFDGNSILASLDDGTYIFVGSKIVIFRPRAPIVEFESPVGNNDVPYPWAMDSAGNYYLLIEDVVMRYRSKLKTDIEKYDGPYGYYYAAGIMTLDIRRIPPVSPIVSHFEGIIEWYVGSEKYNMTYSPNPEKDFDRMISRGEGEMYITKRDGVPRVINRHDFVELMHAFGDRMRFEKLDVIEERG